MSNFRRRFGQQADSKQPATPPRDVAALAAPLAVPAVQVVKSEAPSLSHFGGSPELPATMTWPEFKGKKLDFLARLSLPEIQAALPIDWLPSTGALLFFYAMKEQPWGFDPKDRGSCAVLLVPDLAQARSAPDDPRRDPESCPLPYYGVSFRRVNVLPSRERDSVSALKLSIAEADVYCDLVAEVFGDQPKHQVGGLPYPVQGDAMELECQLASNGLYCGDPSGYKDPRAEALKSGAARWRLLFQFDSDDDLDVMWGDAGTIYYWIDESAARSGNFTNPWLILQCG